MKFLYSCDIHGDKAKYQKLLDLAKEFGVRNIVIAGDLLPKHAKDRAVIQREFIHGWFKEFLRKVNEENIRFIVILGNDDVEAIESEYQRLISNYEFVIDVSQKKVDIEDCSFIGLSEVLDTPFYRKNRIVIEEGQVMPIQRCNEIEIDCGEKIISSLEWEEYRKSKVPTMKSVLEKLPEITEGKKGIFVFHDPPFGIGLDECRDGDIIGSRDILNYIKEKQPFMTLHGHVHESSQVSGNWYSKVNNTICMNCGQSEFGEKKLYFTAIDTERNLFKRFMVSCDLEKTKAKEMDESIR